MTPSPVAGGPRPAQLIQALAAAVLCLAPLALALPQPLELGPSLAELLAAGGVPNLVATVILHTRLYDTVAEVVVFTLASIGVRWILSGEPQQLRIRGLQDAPSVVLCQLGATVCALVGVELALRGHLSPGGGFAAGVAGSGVSSGGGFGEIDSGGWIPLLNVLVAVKVTLGSWAMVQLLVRYRGLL